MYLAKVPKQELQSSKTIHLFNDLKRKKRGIIL